MTGYIEKALQVIIDIIAAMGYWSIGLGMALESANIPLPSEIILPFGGYLASIGRLNFWGVVMAGTVGGTAGSVFSYYLGLKGGRPFLQSYGKYIGISARHLTLAEDWFGRYGEATVFFTRLMPVIRTFISFPAGIAGMNIKRFIVYTFLGSLPWSILLAYIGFKLGQNWELIKPWFHRFDLLLVLAIVTAIAYFYWKKRRA